MSKPEHSGSEARLTTIQGSLRRLWGARQPDGPSFVKEEKWLGSRRYQEEIDDLREWDNDEAAHRIADNIKDLNRSGITNIRLERCYLVKADLERVDLREADLSHANLKEAELREASLFNAKLRLANLNNADLSHANLGHVDLRQASLFSANLREADLSHANLSQAKNWTHRQLAQAISLVGATLPYGKVMTDKDWEKFQQNGSSEEK